MKTLDLHWIYTEFKLSTALKLRTKTREDMSVKNARGTKSAGRKRSVDNAALENDKWKKVLSDNQASIVGKVHWNDDLIKLFRNRVLARDEVDKVLLQRNKNRGYRLIELLQTKSVKHFDEFCLILKGKGYKDLGEGLECAWKAKQVVVPEVREAVTKVIHTVGTNKPTKLQNQMAELLQTKKNIWDNRTKELENKLGGLEGDLNDICTQLLQTVSEDDDTADTGATPVDRIKTYTDQMATVLSDLKEENSKLTEDSSQLREEQENLHRHIRTLERVRHRQKMELQETRSKLAETTKVLDEMRKNMDSMNSEKAQALIALQKMLQEKDSEIESIISTHTSHVEQLQRRMINLEEDDKEKGQIIETLVTQNDQQTMKIQTLEAWQYDQYRKMVNLQSKVDDITSRLEHVGLPSADSLSIASSRVSLRSERSTISSVSKGK